MALNRAAMLNEAVGFSGESVEAVSSAINRYGRQANMEPISVSICQEGSGSNMRNIWCAKNIGCAKMCCTTNQRTADESVDTHQSGCLGDGAAGAEAI